MHFVDFLFVEVAGVLRLTVIILYVDNCNFMFLQFPISSLALKTLQCFCFPVLPFTCSASSHKIFEVFGN